MIRDCLVVGILDKLLSEHLQLDSALTLEKAKKIICQREAVQEQQQVLNKAMSSSLNEVRPTHPGNRRGQRDSVKHNQGPKNHNQPTSRNCSCCGNPSKSKMSH